MSETRITRRAFIGGTIGCCAAGTAVFGRLAQEDESSGSFLQPRKRLPNPFVENGKPIVVIVKGTDFPAMLAKGMEMIGGFAKLGASNPVLVKPNFVFSKRTRYPTTTDEESVLTAIELLRKDGFTDITVADRSAKKIKGRAGGKFEWSGLNDKAESGDFKTDSLLDDCVAESVLVKDARFTVMPAIGVIKKIYESSLIINMPTLKRHAMTGLTCALKNMMGVLDVQTTMDMHLWGDSNKALHDSMPIDDVCRRLGMTIAEAAAAVSPELTVIDARTVLCKHHVSVTGGEPREANRLIISGDPVAADVQAVAVLKEVYEPYEQGYAKDTIEYAAKLGIGVADQNCVVIKQASV